MVKKIHPHKVMTTVHFVKHPWKVVEVGKRLESEIRIAGSVKCEIILPALCIAINSHNF